MDGKLSFLLRQNDLVALALSLLELLLRMSTLILFAALDCLELLLLDLAGLLHNRRDVSVTLDTSDLGLFYSLVGRVVM